MLILCAILFWILNVLYGNWLALKIEKWFDQGDLIRSFAYTYLNMFVNFIMIDAEAYISIKSGNYSVMNFENL